MGRKLVIRKKTKSGNYKDHKPSKSLKKDLGGLWIGDYWLAPGEIVILGAAASIGMLLNSGASFVTGEGVSVRESKEPNSWAIAPRIPQFDFSANYMPPSKSQFSSALITGAFVGVGLGAWLLHDKKPLRKTIYR